MLLRHEIAGNPPRGTNLRTIQNRATASRNQDPNRRQWLPRNFAKPEDLARSHAEAQAELTCTKQALAASKGEAPPADATATPPVTETPRANETPPANEDPAQKAADAGINLTPYSTEYAETGDVSEDNRAKIADGLKNILGEDARSIVDQYIEGQKATAANDMAMYMDTAGSEDNYAAMVKWASETLPKPEIEVINKQLDSTDRTAVTFAITGLGFERGRRRVATTLWANTRWPERPQSAATRVARGGSSAASDALIGWSGAIEGPSQGAVITRSFAAIASSISRRRAPLFSRDLASPVEGLVI